MAENLPLADELSVVFARMSGLLLSEETVASALQLVTSLAQQTVGGTVCSGVTLIDGQGHKTTAAASDALAERADALQYELDEGPCLAAWARQEVVRVDDISTDRRWPRWGRAVQPLGLQAALSAPMVTADSPLGAIKVYADRPGAYDDRDERVLQLFAAQAGILLSNMQSLESAQRLSDGLQDALRSRDVIGTAKGILIARDGISEDTAFAMLVSVSQRENAKLRTVAERLVAAVTRSGGPPDLP